MIPLSLEMIEICAVHSALVEYLASLVPVYLSGKIYIFIIRIKMLHGLINEKLKDVSCETLWQDG